MTTIAGAGTPARVSAVSGLAKAAVALLGLTMLDDVWSAIALLHRASLMSQVSSGRSSVALDTIRAADHQVQVSASVSLLLLVTTAIVFITWLHRTVKALGERHLGPLRYSPGWAIGSWLVPFLNLVRPKQIVDDAYRASAGSPAVPVYFHLWWGLWLTANFVTSGGGRFSTKTPSELVTSDRTVAVGDLVDIVAAALAIAVTLAIARRVAALPAPAVYVANFVFNPPPGWPVPPEGWAPPPEWKPDPAWPPAPEGWTFWLPRPS